MVPQSESFFPVDKPNIASTTHSIDGSVRAVHIAGGSRFARETGDDPVLSCQINDGWRCNMRVGTRSFSVSAVRGKTSLVQPDSRMSMHFEGADARAVQLRMPYRVFDRRLLEEHDWSEGLSALNMLDCEVDLTALHLTARLLFVAGEAREVATETLLAHLLARYGGPTRTVARRGISPVRLKRVRDLVAEDPSRATLRAMADEAGLSLYHFAREFRRETGQTPWTYVVQQRIWAAIGLFETGLPLTDIAHAVGFTDASHMTRAFRIHLGAPPSAVRLKLPPR